MSHDGDVDTWIDIKGKLVLSTSAPTSYNVVAASLEQIRVHGTDTRSKRSFARSEDL